ncbi:MAG: MFS transporter [Actinomycetota bacterium]
MGRTRHDTTLRAAELRDLLGPRNDPFVLESAVDPVAPGEFDERPPATGCAEFAAEAGPFRTYRRRVEWRRIEAHPTDATPDGSGGDRYEVSESAEWHLGFPYWRWIYDPLFKRKALAELPPGTQPWWLFPDRLSPHQATVVSAMALFNVVGGIIFGMLTQVMTFVSADIGDGSASQQTTVFAAVRIGTVLTFAALFLSDSAGRRRIALACCWIAVVATLATAVAPSLLAFTAFQLVARNVSIAALIAIDTIVVEELPPGSRAMAVGLGTLAYGLGAGTAVVALPLADLGSGGWRFVYGLGVLAIPLIISGARHLPESSRFTAMRVETTSGEAPKRRVRGSRFALLAGLFVLVNVFVAPASQLQNDYLRVEQGYSGLTITLLILATSVPGAIGVMAGGRLADTRSRRWTIVVGLLATATFGSVFYSLSGAAMWASALFASVLGAITIAPLGVLGAELFPTSRRGGARGALSVVGVSGSVIGLLSAGKLTDTLGFGPAFALLAIGPLIAAALAFAVPETSGRTLEQLNE